MSLIAHALFNQLKSSQVILFQGDEPAALVDIKVMAQRILGESVHYDEILSDETGDIAKTRMVLGDLYGRPVFYFSTNTHPVLGANADVIIDVAYFDNRFLNQGPRLVELSVSKSKGFKKCSGESITLNPYE